MLAIYIATQMLRRLAIIYVLLFCSTSGLHCYRFDSDVLRPRICTAIRTLYSCLNLHLEAGAGGGAGTGGRAEIGAAEGQGVEQVRPTPLNLRW